MPRLRNMSIGSKMTLLACVSAGVALLIVSIGFALYGALLLRDGKLRLLEDRAQVLAFYSAPIVTVRDELAGRRLLESLQTDTTVEVARIYDREQQLLSSFSSSIESPSTTREPSWRDRWLNCGFVEITHPIQAGQTTIGSIYLRANTKDVQAKLSQFLLIAAYGCAIAMSVAILLACRLQGALARPIRALTQAVCRVTADADYTIRVESSADAELKTLQEAFNRMLDRIESSERKLQRAHDELEERVAERTRELSQEIARRKVIQEDLERAKEAAETANLAKTEFLANMSHEIRTPLNGIVGFTDLLLRDAEYDVASEQRDYLQTIHRSGLHFLDLISDILDLSKIEAGRLDVERIDCSPHRIIAEVVSVTRVRAIEKGLALDCQWNGPIPETIQSDPARLRQLLINLVSNAIKFTEQGGIRIVASATSENEAQLQIEVIDTGIGIPSEKLEEIFDPFCQADSSVTRRFGGTGLGLAICRKITAALGGQLTVTSEVDAGSTFTVLLNVGSLVGVRMLQTPDLETLEEGRARPNQLVTLPPASILVVDDGDTNRKLIQLVLRRAGAELTAAENGQQALDLAQQQSFDLILMDMQMPVLDGYTASRRLRELGVGVPIIALTALAMKGDEQKCRDAGCSGYLTKPVDVDRLLSVVAGALEDSPCQAASEP